jgi:hypothetical protein
MEDTFGKCPENPLLFRNISDSILFMDAIISFGEIKHRSI